MIRLFVHIFNMSVAAGWVVLAILLLRLVLRKAPKWIFVLLWGAVALRLLVPVFVQSSASLVPSTQTISPQIMEQSVPQIHIGISTMNSAINPVIGQAQIAVSPEKSVNVVHVIAPILTGVWVVGCCGLLGYCLVSFLRIRKRVATAVLLESGVYESDRIDDPFLLGLWKPRIYLPFGLDTRERQYIIAHEKAHIRRKDHLWKPLGYLLLTVYWFHPLLWLAYWLLCRDIELACDEKVAHTMDPSQRADYSQTLLNHTVKRSMISACPLAFGQGSVKRRVKSVLNYKKPTFWVLLVAIIAGIVLTVCFLTDPADSEKKPVASVEPSQPQSEPTEPSGPAEEIPAVNIDNLKRRYPQYFDLPAKEGLSVYIWQMASQSYQCVLVQGKDTIYTQEKLWDYHKVATTIDNMRAIVGTYDLDRSMVSIKPIQMWHSSYGYTIDEEYTEQLQELFWNGTPMTTPAYKGYIDKASFDIDGDGEIEHCTIGYVHTSGRFTFKLHVLDGDREYSDTFGCEAGELSFIENEKGVFLQLSPSVENALPVLYSVSAKDGQIKLTHFAFGDDTGMSLLWDAAEFDIDQDGKTEHCILSHGYTSGFFTFNLTALEDGVCEYQNGYNGHAGSLSFAETEDGWKIKQELYNSSQIIYYDISIRDGNVVLSHNGEEVEFYGPQGADWAYQLFLAMNEDGEITYAESHPEQIP